MVVPYVALLSFPVTTRTDFLGAFQLVHNRPARADKDSQLEFGAAYQVTCGEGSSNMAPRWTRYQIAREHAQSSCSTTT
jgi:hypothetical protein